MRLENASAEMPKECGQGHCRAHGAVSLSAALNHQRQLMRQPPASFQHGPIDPQRGRQGENKLNCSRFKVNSSHPLWI